MFAPNAERRWKNLATSCRGSVPKLITLSYENLLDRVERAWHVTEFLANGVMIGAKLSDQVCVFFHGEKAIVRGQ
jgi:hypothetical protein